MEEIVAALRAQREELEAMLSGLDAQGWSLPVPSCPGWDVTDVVLHLAQTDELAVASVDGSFTGFGEAGGASVDEAAEASVREQRDAPPAAIHARWKEAGNRQLALLAAADPGARVTWVVGQLAARTLATTRLSETWIHSGDVAGALGVKLAPTDRLWHIARLAWRTIPYAFERDGRAAPGDVCVVLDAPDGATWSFGEAGAPNTITGLAIDFCLVAGRRLEPSNSALVGSGPDAEAVLALVRTYA